MRHLKLCFICGVLCIPLSSSAQTEFEKRMPPIKDLPKVGESKEFYQLPEICDYQVFDSLGNSIEKGTGEFIDVTHFKKGNYFIRYLNRKVIYRKEN